MDQPLEDPGKPAVLVQAIWIRRCRSEFTLFDNHCLSVKTQGFMQDARDYMVDIRILDPHLKRSFKIAWGYLTVFCALCGAAGFFAFSGLTQNTTLLSIILVVCTVPILILAIYRSHDRIVFYSQHGRVPLVVLFNRSPDRLTLDAFTVALVERIKNAKNHNQGANKILSEELKEHRRLMEEGIISSNRYDIIKQRILGQHS